MREVKSDVIGALVPNEHSFADRREIRRSFPLLPECTLKSAHRKDTESQFFSQVDGDNGDAIDGERRLSWGNIADH